jgi:ATP-dependent Clp protease ATP-binding subunit ClpC
VNSKDVILFLDELHTIVGAGGAEGSLDASNIFKPSLSRGEIQCIGATTLNEYRKYIEKDGALERRFQTIMVDPPSTQDTKKILYGLKKKYEEHHRIIISDEGIDAAVKLSERYITGKFQPDKAIDVIDEAGSRIHLATCTRPEVFEKLEEELVELQRDKDKAVKNQEFERAAQLRDDLKIKKESLDQMRRDWEQGKGQERVTLSEEDVACVVSKMTGIPLFKLEEKESKKLLRMEDELKKRVVGQQEAITVISKAIRRNRAGLGDPRRPIGSLIFLGPTGVGKTELARALAAALFEDESSLIRIDMSEYMEKFSVSRLIGAPPGYVGYEEGGQLTEKVRRKPYSVVLLDEIEKAHPDVFNILLQLFDDGALTDSFGRRVDFRNTVVIMTSNLGAREIKGGKTLGFQKEDSESSYQQMRQKLLEETRKAFNPEFLNRIDETIVFHSLGLEEVMQIIDILLADVSNRLEDKGITFELTSRAKEFLAEKGFNPTFGARPLKRTIQKHVEDPLAEEILKGQFSGRCEVVVDRSKDQDKLSFQIKTVPQEEEETAPEKSLK